MTMIEKMWPLGCIIYKAVWPYLLFEAFLTITFLMFIKLYDFAELEEELPRISVSFLLFLVSIVNMCHFHTLRIE